MLYNKRRESYQKAERITRRPPSFVPNVFHDIPHLTVQYPAKHIYRMGTDTLIPLHTGELSRTDVVLFNQRILRDALFLHHVPHIIV